MPKRSKTKNKPKELLYFGRHAMVPYFKQPKKARRIVNTRAFYALLLKNYGSPELFQKALLEAGIDAPCLTFDLEKFIDQIIKNFNKVALKLPYTTKLSRQQYEQIRTGFSICGRMISSYRTVQRHWQRQPQLSSQLTTKSFFDAVDGGVRVISSPVELEGLPLMISVSHKLLWILYTAKQYILDLL